MLYTHVNTNPCIHTFISRLFQAEAIIHFSIDHSRLGWKNAERVLIFRYQFTQYVQRPIWYFWLNSRSCLKWAKSLCVISCVCWLKICHSSSAKKVLFEKPPLAISWQAFQHWFPCIIRHIQLAFNKKRYILPDFLFSFLCYDFMKPFRMLWQASRPLQTTKSWRK